MRQNVAKCLHQIRKIRRSLVSFWEMRRIRRFFRQETGRSREGRAEEEVELDAPAGCRNYN